MHREEGQQEDVRQEGGHQEDVWQEDRQQEGGQQEDVRQEDGHQEEGQQEEDVRQEDVRQEGVSPGAAWSLAVVLRRVPVRAVFCLCLQCCCARSSNHLSPSRPLALLPSRPVALLPSCPLALSPARPAEMDAGGELGMTDAQVSALAFPELRTLASALDVLRPHMTEEAVLAAVLEARAVVRQAARRPEPVPAHRVHRHVPWQGLTVWVVLQPLLLVLVAFLALGTYYALHMTCHFTAARSWACVHMGVCAPASMCGIVTAASTVHATTSQLKDMLEVFNNLSSTSTSVVDTLNAALRPYQAKDLQHVHPDLARLADKAAALKTDVSSLIEAERLESRAVLATFYQVADTIQEIHWDAAMLPETSASLVTAGTADGGGDASVQISDFYDRTASRFQTMAAALRVRSEALKRLVDTWVKATASLEEFKGNQRLLGKSLEVLIARAVERNEPAVSKLEVGAVSAGCVAAAAGVLKFAPLWVPVVGPLAIPVGVVAAGLSCAAVGAVGVATVTRNAEHWHSDVQVLIRSLPEAINATLALIHHAQEQATVLDKAAFQLERLSIAVDRRGIGFSNFLDGRSFKNLLPFLASELDKSETEIRAIAGSYVDTVILTDRQIAAFKASRESDVSTLPAQN